MMGPASEVRIMKGPMDDMNCVHLYDSLGLSKEERQFAEDVFSGADMSVDRFKDLMKKVVPMHLAAGGPNQIETCLTRVRALSAKLMDDYSK